MRRIYAEEPIFGKASNRLAATPMVGCNPSRVLEFAAIHHHAMNARVTDANDFAFFLHALRATDGTNFGAVYTGTNLRTLFVIFREKHVV